MAAGASRRTRAAASSIASGRPSSRAQISSIACTSSPSGSNPGLAARARSTKSSAAADGSSGGTGCSRSARTRSGARLVTSTFTARRGGDELGELRSRRQHVLEVVEHEQGALVAELASEALRVGVGRAELLGERGEHEAGVGERLELDEHRSAREVAGRGGRGGQR